MALLLFAGILAGGTHTVAGEVSPETRGLLPPNYNLNITYGMDGVPSFVPVKYTLDNTTWQKLWSWHRKEVLTPTLNTESGTRDAPCFEGVDALILFDNLKAAIVNVESSRKDLKGYSPLLESLEQAGTQVTPIYYMTFVNSGGYLKKRVMVDPAFARIRAKLRSRVGPAHASARRSLISVPVPSDTHLRNTIVFIEAMTTTVMQALDTPDPGVVSTAQYAMGLQLYTNLATKTGAFVVDATKFGLVVRAGFVESASKLTQSILNLGRYVNIISHFDVVFTSIAQIASIGFDIYILAYATTDAERNPALASLVLGSVNLGLVVGSGVAGAVATKLGAKGASVAAASAAVALGSTAAALSYLTVPLSGLAFGIAALVGAFQGIADDAIKVGEYFFQLEVGFKSGAYHMDSNGTFVPNPHSVIEEINFQTDIVTMGSPLLSKYSRFHTLHPPEVFIRLKQTGIVDENTVNGKVFDIRERLEEIHCTECTRTQTQHFSLRAAHGDGDERFALQLPIAPKSVIGYSHFILPFATSRNDRGFEVLRALERDDDFVFAFYRFPSHYILNRLTHYFLDTHVTVVMDEKHRVLVAPSHTNREVENAWGKLYYHIVGSTGLAEIILQYGVHFVLEAPESSDPSFVLDVTLLEDDPSIEVNVDDRTGNKKLLIGPTMWVTYTALTKLSTVMIRGKNWQKELIVEENRIILKSVIVDQVSPEELTTMLKTDGNRERATSERYIQVIGSVDNIKNPAYDTKDGTLLYTHGVTPSDTVLLGVQSKEFGCFASFSQTRVWCSNLLTHQIIIETQFGDASKFKLRGFLFVAGNVAMVEIQRVETGSLHNMQSRLSYQFFLMENACLLSKVQDFRKNDSTSTSGSLESALKIFNTQMTSIRGAAIDNNIIVTAQMGNWVAYERQIVATHSRKARHIPIYEQQAWYAPLTKMTILPRAINGPAFGKLSFMPFPTANAMASGSSPPKEVEILFHEESSAQVFRYESAQDGGELVVVRRNVVRVFLIGTAWFGVTTEGSIVEFWSTRDVQIVGYTQEVFRNHSADWWQKIGAEDRPSALIVPLYMNAPGALSTRSWYIPQDNLYVLVDRQFNEGRSINCVGITTDKAAALLVTDKGTMWWVPVVPAKDILFTSEGALQPKMQPLAKEWIPGKSIVRNIDEQILDAGWEADGMILETSSGLVIEARDLTTTSAEFVLRELHVQGAQNANEYKTRAETAYRHAVTLRVGMPDTNFIPTRTNLARGYMTNVRDPTNAKFHQPSHEYPPLGVHAKSKTMVFFDAEWQKRFHAVIRQGNSLHCISSSDIIAWLPDLEGVNKVTLLLKDSPQKVRSRVISFFGTHSAVAQRYETIAIDTTHLTSDHDVMRVSFLGAGALSDISIQDGAEQRIVLKDDLQHVLIWRGLPLQTMTVLFENSPKLLGTRSATTQDGDGYDPWIVLGAVGIIALVVAIGVAIVRSNQKKQRTFERRE